MVADRQTFPRRGIFWWNGRVKVRANDTNAITTIPTARPLGNGLLDVSESPCLPPTASEALVTPLIEPAPTLRDAVPINCLA